jgi:hypothetical protein
MNQAEKSNYRLWRIGNDYVVQTYWEGFYGTVKSCKNKEEAERELALMRKREKRYALQ